MVNRASSLRRRRLASNLPCSELRSPRRAPLARSDATDGEQREGPDAGTYRRWRHGGADDRSGAAGVGRLYDDRCLRADAHAEHRGSGAEHPPERRTAGAVAGRRPRRRGPQGPARGSRRRQGGDPQRDADGLGGRLDHAEAARPQHVGERQRRLPPHAPPRPADVPLQAGPRVRAGDGRRPARSRSTWPSAWRPSARTRSP